jgi:hypothetical protein
VILDSTDQFWSLPGLTRQSSIFANKMDHQVTALRAGPVMTGNQSGEFRMMGKLEARAERAVSA